jgi:molybdopterin-guanine dinucleotide biosynthesis protein A
MNYPDISAFIIAGGQSKRFGRDKALFSYCGRPLIEHVIETLQRSFGRVAIVADRADRFRYPGIPCYADIIAGLGPIGGVFTALCTMDTARVFVFACDMPGLNADLITYMKNIPGEHDAVVPLIGGQYEPLHAIYANTCLAPIEQIIRAGQRRVVSFFDRVSVCPVTEEEIRKFVDPSLAFRNINYFHEANVGQAATGE